MIEDKLEKVAYNADAEAKLYARLNGVYDKLDMKMGLILQGVNISIALVMPFLQKMAEQRRERRRKASEGGHN